MIKELLSSLEREDIQFKDVLSFIDEHYVYQASAFQNGTLYNSQNENQGSARVFSLGQLENLSVEDTLKLFAEHYTSVLVTPDSTDHQNIRQFIKHGFEGLKFEHQVLTRK